MTQLHRHPAPETVSIVDIRVGDLVDLQGDPIADPGRTHEHYADDLVVVGGTRLRADDSVEISFSDGGLFEFPAGHGLVVWGHDDDWD